MSLLRNICARGCWATSPLNPMSPKNLLVPRRSVVIKAATAPPCQKGTFEEKNSKLGRPLSPHLTIYKPQLTAIMSISHRITGLALSAYVIGLGTGSLSGIDIDSYINSHDIPGFIGVVTKFLIAFPFSYHLLNGIRHLSWDYGLGLSIKEVYLTGYVVLVLATILALYLTSITTQKKKA